MSLRGSTTAMMKADTATEVAVPARVSFSGVAPPCPAEPIR